MSLTTINFKDEHNLLTYLRDVASHKTLNRNGFFRLNGRAYLNADWDRMVTHAQSLKRQGFLSELRIGVGKRVMLFKFPPPPVKDGYPHPQHVREERTSDPFIETLVNLWDKQGGGN